MKRPEFYRRWNYCFYAETNDFGIRHYFIGDFPAEWTDMTSLHYIRITPIDKSEGKIRQVSKEEYDNLFSQFPPPTR